MKNLLKISILVIVFAFILVPFINTFAIDMNIDDYESNIDNTIEEDYEEEESFPSTTTIDNPTITTTSSEDDEFLTIENILSSNYKILNSKHTIKLKIENNRTNLNRLTKELEKFKVAIEDKEYKSMTYIGRKPTVNNEDTENIEVHIFDFNQDIYDKDIKVRFVSKIRDEHKFESLDDLKKQIEKDERIIKEIL